MEESPIQKANRVIMAIINNNTLMNKEHGCKLVLHMEIPQIK